MVQVNERGALPKKAEIEISDWLDQLAVELKPEDRELLAAAGELAIRCRHRPGVDRGDWSSDSDCYGAGLEIVEILSALHVDANCLIAGLLYRSVREQRLPLRQVEAQFGSRVATLIVGVLRMARISDLKHISQPSVAGQRQKDNLRKMLVAIIDDVRVALIKLAERCSAIRAVKGSRERRTQLAQEVFDIYAPLAHRLGIGQLKWELEDLSFRYIYADSYKRIATLLHGRRLERVAYIKRVQTHLQRVLNEAGVVCEVNGRAKHIYSIWRKMQRKAIGFSQVYDIHALRIQVETVADCYTTLGVVHGLWRSIPDEFDDYIANPKENGYRSLHTAVIGPEGSVVEVQIRTVTMHQESELGVCAHWRYKGTDSESRLANTYEEKIAWLRHALEWYESDGVDSEQQFSFDMAQDRVYIFTPKGSVVNVAQGATPLDFAYHVHTEVGHRCRGARVNGAMVPLTYVLKTGERVEILTSDEIKPKREWLQPKLGYLRTARARAKLQQWFRAQSLGDRIAGGQEALQSEFKRLSIFAVNIGALAKRCQCETSDDLYARIGSGELIPADVLPHVSALARSEKVGPELPDKTQVVTSRIRTHQPVVNKFGGVGSRKTKLADCCQPQPADQIDGYIDDAGRVIIHRDDCAELRDLGEQNPDRLLTVHWQHSTAKHLVKVPISLEAYDRPNLLRDISELLALSKTNIASLNTLVDQAKQTVVMKLSLEITSLDSLSELMSKLSVLDNVITVQRVTEGQGNG